jgi:hypothetical protein
MSMFIVSLLISFTFGYGVREIISRRRRKKYLRRDQRVVNRWQPNELEMMGSNLGTKRKRRIKRTKVAVSSPESPEHAK